VTDARTSGSAPATRSARSGKTRSGFAARLHLRLLRGRPAGELHDADRHPLDVRPDAFLEGPAGHEIDAPTEPVLEKDLHVHVAVEGGGLEIHEQVHVALDRSLVAHGGNVL